MAEPCPRRPESLPSLATGHKYNPSQAAYSTRTRRCISATWLLRRILQVPLVTRLALSPTSFLTPEPHGNGCSLKRPVGVEVFLVSRDPVGRDFALGSRQIQFSLAHEVMQAVFELVFDAGVPHDRIGLGP